MLGAFRKQQAHVSKKVIPESSKKLYFTKNSGTTLADYCDRTPKIPEPLAKTFFLDIAGAVNYIHSQGVVHGDIKEENILVGVEAETLKRVLKLCDFGYSRKGIPGSAPMKIYGTREFCPPELVDNMSKYMQRKKTKHGVVGYAQDVWALGLVLYLMIHGILPMETDSLLDKSLDITGCTYTQPNTTNVSPQCRDILQKMLTIDPDRITMPQIMDHPWLSEIDIEREI
ncbi:hypothetical protein BASA81_009696 [Batrachochytrium salamandrivorans]|nr:hypothetical protein BASA81_009696 [Batrachochytrium salamandrivorans]